MPVTDQLTDQFYGINTAGLNRVVQDFGLCDLKGEYLYTAKARTKGLLVVVFFDPASPPSVRALEAVQAWTADLPTQKWTALGVSEGGREEMTQFADARKIDGVTLLLDYELYQTRRWGVSNLPSVYLIAGKTGRVLAKAIGDDAATLEGVKKLLSSEVAKIVAAEEAAKKADEEKKASEAAAKAAETVKPTAPTKA
jgi:peroxiredoxin